MVKAGIIHPPKVIRTALVDAASVSMLLTTTEALVIERGDAKVDSTARPTTFSNRRRLPNDNSSETIAQQGISIDPDVCEEAVQAMNLILHYLPQCRCAVMRGMVNFIYKLLDELPLPIQISLGRLVELMHYWRAFLTEKNANWS